MWEAIEVTGRVVEGSQGQPRPNPLYKQVQEFQAEARQLEDRFGLSPMSRLRLGITFADAQASLDGLNARLAAKMSEVEGDLWADFDEA
jgi:P27 family predicted phage terminase small subunit